jgi:DNA-binding response OmpR family regulator
MMRIAILEDDPALADQMAHALEAAGHGTQRFRTGAALVTALKRDTFDLLVLDWNLPDTSGIEVLSWAREHLDGAPPVLFVTSRGDEADIVRALNLGADDYVVKPIKVAELQARVGALLRRSFPTQVADVQVFGDMRFDVGRQAVIVRGQEVIVTNKEFSLALLLFQNLDRPLSRAYLLDKIWGISPDLQTRTLDAHVSRIRTKLGLRPEAGYRLAPVYSYGYRLEKFAGEPEEN